MDPLHETAGSSPLNGSEPPQREVDYKFHRAVKRTYGSRRSELQPSSSPSSTSLASAGASDPWNFEASVTKDSIHTSETPKKTRRLIADLQRSSLNDDSDDSGDDGDCKVDERVCGGNSHLGDTEDMLEAADDLETPSKRRRSGRLEKRLSELHELPDKRDQVPWTSTTPLSSAPSTPIATKSHAFVVEVSLPARSHADATNAQDTSGLPTPTSSASTSAGSSTKVARGSSAGPAGQTSISSFFTAKTPVRGTGLLPKLSQHQRSRCDSPTTSPSTIFENAGKTSTPTQDETIPNSSTSSPFTDTTTCGKNTLHSSSSTAASIESSSSSSKRLEQLFLAFTPDRAKHSSLAAAASSSSSSKQINTIISTSARRQPNKRYQCPQCGMPYVRGQPEDEAIHDRYHRTVVGGIDYPGYKNEVVIAHFDDDESVETNRRLSTNFGAQESEARIVVISMSDTATGGSSSFEKKKVKEIMQVVNQELGSIDLQWDQLQACKVYLYISGKKKVVGCLVAERIEQAYEVVLDPVAPATATAASPQSTAQGSKSSSVSSQSSAASRSLSSISTLSSSSSTTSSSSRSVPLSSSRSGSAIFCSTEPRKAVCGINRIWVNASHRRRGVATRMLDAVRESFVYACRLQREDLAFSQPTGDGRSLAQKYLQTEKFLVYVE